MSVNWKAGLMRWFPHGSQHPGFEGPYFTLNHLHPFRFTLDMEATKISPARSVQVHVGFGLHTFTRNPKSGDLPHSFYSDDREKRVFDEERYELSLRLPEIVRSWPEGRPPCSRAKDENYVSIDLGSGDRYAVFFNVKRWTAIDKNSVLLVVQSAYLLSPQKAPPGKERFSFTSIIGKAMSKGRDADPPAPLDYRQYIQESENPTGASSDGVP